MPGPPPKRADQRRRQNKTAPVDTVALSERVPVPELALTGVHPLAADLFESLKTSGQSMYYEPSDWQRARLMVEMLSHMLFSGRRSSQMYAAIQQDLRDLMVCEADRRRLRIEIERGSTDTSEHDAQVAQMAAYRRVAST